MWWLVLVFIILAIVILIFVLRPSGSGVGFPWIKFYTRGRESGFSFKEIRLLRKVAVESHLKDPTSLFWSVKQLDRSIRGIIIKMKSEGIYGEAESAEFVSKLFDFRRTVEMNLPKYKIGLKSTRKLPAHLRLKISAEGIGTFSAQIVENLRRYMAVSYPEGPVLPEGFSWAGQKVSIYFWRKDDAGYVFQTRILDDFIDKKYPILHMAHSEEMIRSQRRNSVRVDVARPGYIYPLNNISGANEFVEQKPGLRCRTVDVSETGAAVLVGGRAKVGLPVKIQFQLTTRPVVMCGVVKGVSYNQKRNQSILHIQCVPLSDRTKNHLLCYVYNLFGDREPLIKGQRKS